MTFEEATARLSEICEGIARQNRELIAGLDEDDFDPGVRLDNTKNNAAYRLTDFFEILKSFPYGNTPRDVTDDVITTTDELLDKIRQRYGDAPPVLDKIIRAGQAFRSSKRIWRITNPVRPLTQDEYEHQLDQTLCTILCALDDLNLELCRLPLKRDRKKSSTHTKRTPFMLEQIRIFKAYLDKRPVCASYSLITRARQCWREHKAEWDKAARNKSGYACYKTLSRTVQYRN